MSFPLTDSFQTRFSRGLRFEDLVKRTLWLSGFRAYAFGHDLLPGPAKDILVRLTDPTSRFMRYLPDLAVSIEGKGSFLVEVKSGPREAENIAFEKESWEACRVLTGIGVSILVAVPGPGDGEIRAQWFGELHVEKEFKRPPRVNYNGSGRPFYLIKKSDLPTLGQALREFKIED